MVLKRLQTISVALLLALLTAGGVILFHGKSSTEALLESQLAAETQKNAELEQQKEELKKVVSRLEYERRVAQIIVTKQTPLSDSGSIYTTLRFVEYARDGVTALPAREFTIEGKRAHIDAMVIKFDTKALEEGDPLRGHSIGLFTKLYGEKQAPEQGFPIDSPKQEPEFYRGADPQVPKFEQDLWHDFWKMADDPAYAQTRGVKVAQGEGVWGDFNKGRLYTLKLQADGNPNLTSEPAPAIYENAFDSTPATSPAAIPR
jgi:hypothetical protein